MIQVGVVGRWCDVSAPVGPSTKRPSDDVSLRHCTVQRAMLAGWLASGRSDVFSGGGVDDVGIGIA